MDKDQVKTEIARLKAERKENAKLNNESVVAYRARAKANKAISEQIHELEASIRTERSTVKLESLTVEQVEKLLADLKTKNAAEPTEDEVPD